MFAVLDGISLELIACRDGAVRSRAFVKEIFIRASFLFGLGLFLSQIGSGIEVILDYYAVFFLLSIPFLLHTVKPKAALIAGVLLLAVGPAVQDVFLDALAQGAYMPPWASVPFAYLVNGAYPAVVYMGFVLLGVWGARTILNNEARVTWRSVVWFACGLIAARSLSTVWGGSEATYTPLFRSVENLGSLFSCLFWTVLLFRLLDQRPQRLGQRLGRPISQFGQAPVTFYVLHVIVMAVWVASSGIAAAQSVSLLLVQLAALCIAASMIAASGKRGPLEALSGWAARPPRKFENERKEDEVSIG